MSASFRSIRIPTGFLIGALVAVVVLQAFGQAGRMRAPLVATVDLPAVLEQLNERADAEAKLRTIADEIRQEQETREGEIRDIKNRFENAVDDDERAALEEEAALKALQYQAWLRFATDKLDVERSLLLENLYRTIQAAVTDMAQASGIDVVVLDDSLNELGVNPELRVSREAQIRQQIIGRRVLYSNPQMNLTEDLVERMNNAYNAAVGP